jgi:biopolymer transport protein ExbB/TolQ
MQNNTLWQGILQWPLFQAEWVLWLLVILSIASLAIMLERWRFFSQRRVDLNALEQHLTTAFSSRNLEQGIAQLAQHDTLPTRVAHYGLQGYRKGPEAVEDLFTGALAREKQRYDKNLTFLATVGSNAPFIGLFGTVLGIIRAFRDMSGNMTEAGSAVMAGIAEALIATAVGLLVAIPAVVAYNVFRSATKRACAQAEVLCRLVLAELKSTSTHGE